MLMFRNPDDTMENDFINAAKANDLHRLNYLMNIEELQVPELSLPQEYPVGTNARRQACYEAARHDHPEVLALVYKRGVGLSDTCILVLLKEKRKRCIDVLLNLGWDIHWSLGHYGDPLSMSLKDLDMVHFLLSRGADPNKSWWWFPNMTVLELAARYEGIPVIEALIDAGAEWKNRHVLAEAAGNGNGRLDVVNYLLDRGAPIDGIGTNPWLYDVEKQEFTVKDAVFRNALCQAAYEGQAEVVQLLLERGADPTIKDTDGRTAAELAEMRGHQACLELLNKL
ncbi:hypothetical protein BDW74DRAFT_153260 [Aspergillus multicolor]|uniref:ankyrin repeat domain-containing protein n=1 Tax=Aspergillus multicolor TaxID=41759 RepID=UPI003CCD6B7D